MLSPHGVKMDYLSVGRGVKMDDLYKERGQGSSGTAITMDTMGEAAYKCAICNKNLACSVEFRQHIKQECDSSLELINICPKITVDLSTGRDHCSSGTVIKTDNLSTGRGVKMDDFSMGRGVKLDEFSKRRGVKLDDFSKRHGVKLDDFSKRHGVKLDDFSKRRGVKLDEFSKRHGVKLDDLSKERGHCSSGKTITMDMIGESAYKCAICNKDLASSVEFRQHIKQGCASSLELIEIGPKITVVNMSDLSTGPGQQSSGTTTRNSAFNKRNTYIHKTTKCISLNKGNNNLINVSTINIHKALPISDTAIQPGVPATRNTTITTQNNTFAEISEREMNVCANGESADKYKHSLASRSNIYMCALCKTGLKGSSAFKEHLSKHRVGSSDTKMDNVLSMTTDVISKDISVESSSTGKLLFSENDFQIDNIQQELENENHASCIENLVDVAPSARPDNTPLTHSDTQGLKGSTAFKEHLSKHRVDSKMDNTLSVTTDLISKDISIESSSTGSSLFSENDFQFDICQQESEKENHVSFSASHVDVTPSVWVDKSLLTHNDFCQQELEVKSDSSPKNKIRKTLPISDMEDPQSYDVHSLPNEFKNRKEGMPIQGNVEENNGGEHGFTVTDKVHENSDIKAQHKPQLMTCSHSRSKRNINQRENGEKPGKKFKFSVGSKYFYICPVCHMRFVKCKDYINHTNFHMDVNEHQGDCESSCLGQDNPSVICRKSLNPFYVCGKCKKRFIMKIHLENHLKLQHDKKKEYRHKCTSCNESFPKLHSLVHHRKTFHSSELHGFKSQPSVGTAMTQTANYVCVEMGENAKRLANERNLKEKSNRKANKNVNTSFSDVYNKRSKKSKLNACIVCNRTFQDFSALRDHLSRPCAPAARNNAITEQNHTVLGVREKERNADDISIESLSKGSSLFSENDLQFGVSQQELETENHTSCTENNVDVATGARPDNSLLTDSDFCQTELEVDNYFSPRLEIMGIKDESKISKYLHTGGAGESQATEGINMNQEVTSDKSSIDKALGHLQNPSRIARHLKRKKTRRNSFLLYFWNSFS